MLTASERWRSPIIKANAKFTEERKLGGRVPRCGPDPSRKCGPVPGLVVVLARGRVANNWGIGDEWLFEWQGAAMTIELDMLVLAIVLGFVHIILAAHFAGRQYGVQWNMGPRDDRLPPLEPVAGRLERASHNFRETFPLFAAAVLIAHLAGHNGTLTALGTQLYFWARRVPASLRVRCAGGAHDCLWRGGARHPFDPIRPGVKRRAGHNTLTP